MRSGSGLVFDPSAGVMRPALVGFYEEDPILSESAAAGRGKSGNQREGAAQAGERPAQGGAHRGGFLAQLLGDFDGREPGQAGHEDDLARFLGHLVERFLDAGEGLRPDRELAWRPEGGVDLAGGRSLVTAVADQAVDVTLLRAQVLVPIGELAPRHREEPVPERRLTAVVESFEVLQGLAANGLREVLLGIPAPHARPHPEPDVGAERGQVPFEKRDDRDVVTLGRGGDEGFGVVLHGRAMIPQNRWAAGKRRRRRLFTAGIVESLERPKPRARQSQPSSQPALCSGMSAPCCSRSMAS